MPALIEALKDSDAEVRATSAMALGQFEDKRAGAPLVALLKDGNVEVRRAALYALQSTEAEVPVDAIVAALGDADDEIRQAALGLALSRLHRDGEEDLHRRTRASWRSSPGCWPTAMPTCERRP